MYRQTRLNKTAVASIPKGIVSSAHPHCSGVLFPPSSLPMILSVVLVSLLWLLKFKKGGEVLYIIRLNPLFTAN